MMDKVGMNTIKTEKVFNKLELIKELMYKIKKFFTSNNVNSLSKIIAKEIQIDSIVDDNIKMIEKFANENPIMRTSEIVNNNNYNDSSVKHDNIESKFNIIDSKVVA
jgi:hypothetical protein